MKSTLDALRLMLNGGLALINGLGIMQAQIDRLAAEAGIDLRIPRKKVRDLTPEMIAYILENYPLHTEAVWLQPNGPRDQICMRFNLNGYQVASVLGTVTRRERASAADVNAPTSLEAEVPKESEPIVQTVPVSVQKVPDVADQQPSRSKGRVTDYTPRPIVDDPTSWPKREANGSSKIDLDKTDWAIARAVIKADRWSELRKEIGQVRSLSSQQVAGMKATLSRGDIPLVFRDAA